MQLLSYKNDENLKKEFLEQIIKHRKADQIIKGTYGKENGKWKGCAVGCSLRSLAIIRGDTLKVSYQNHADYEKYLGMPEWLAQLEDTIFEGLPVEEAKLWPEKFAKAVPVGVNLEPVKWKFCSYLLKDNIDRVLSLNISDELKKQVVDAIRKVLAVHQEAIKTGEWSGSAARSAESAARSAARSAESAESAARSAAWSAAWSAGSAAWSAESAAWSAESAAHQKHAKQLLKFLKEAK